LPAAPAPAPPVEPLYLRCRLLLLVAVMLFGDVGKGAQRWLDLGVLRFQPSEMVKLAVPMMVAWFLPRARCPELARLLAGRSSPRCRPC